MSCQYMCTTGWSSVFYQIAHCMAVNHHASYILFVLLIFRMVPHNTNRTCPSATSDPKLYWRTSVYPPNMLVVKERELSPRFTCLLPLTPLCKVWDPFPLRFLPDKIQEGSINSMIVDFHICVCHVYPSISIASVLVILHSPPTFRQALMQP